MTEDIKGFIEKNIHLIENNEYNKLYAEADEKFLTFNAVGKVTQVLYDIGVDPLKYMKSIPRGCFYGTDFLNSFTVPENIVTVGYAAFANSSLKNLTIPEHVSIVYDRILDKCNINTLQLSHKTALTSDVFFRCSIDTIIFEGTVEQWTRMYSDVKAVDIICDDGRLSNYDQ